MNSPEVRQNLEDAFGPLDDLEQAFALMHAFARSVEEAITTPATVTTVTTVTATATTPDMVVAREEDSGTSDVATTECLGGSPSPSECLNDYWDGVRLQCPSPIRRFPLPTTTTTTTTTMQQTIVICGDDHGGPVIEVTYTPCGSFTAEPVSNRRNLQEL